jgi:hypothetical protein
LTDWFDFDFFDAKAVPEKKLRGLEDKKLGEEFGVWRLSIFPPSH